ncbi:unnamed protein product [Microthlaspi erraticum]|uniref:Reverse transcriptase zinc-binding domain-containing protein n=1 Tax=Microthlaspi erraticum TaxID=1685480 RepID=A0A6D2JHK7_9BRAS|nr:unnamed protein product [Microthlaspi erraticum]
MASLRSLARPFLLCRVVLGTSALFWHDDWTGLGPLLDIAGPNGPRVTGISSLASVSSACHNGAWLLSRGRHPILQLLRACVPANTPPSLSSLPDIYLWRNGPSRTPGKFSSSQTWTSLHPPAPSVPWYKLIWQKDRIPKHAFISWILMRDRLSTRDRLISWGLDVPNRCLLCDTSPESKSHLFFTCPFSAEVWNSLHSHPDLISSTVFEDIISWLHSPTLNGKLKTICLLSFQAAIYFLWRERNSRLHTQITKPSHLLVKEIHLTLRAKLFGIDRSLTVRSLPVDQSGSYLQTWFSFFQF